MQEMGLNRGCGKRVLGGVYAEVPQSPFGEPVEHFLIDPPKPIVPDEIGLTPIGVLPVQRTETTHIMDWVGSEGYPNVADFVEEARRYGVSRRLPKTFDFSLLSRLSRLVLVHAKAWIVEAERFEREIPGDVGPVGCPKGLHDGSKDEAPCLGLCWFDVQPMPEDAGEEPYGFEREMPWGRYPAVWTPGKRKHRPAVFASFPVGQITVIRDPEGGTHNEVLEKIGNLPDLPVVLEEQ